MAFQHNVSKHIDMMNEIWPNLDGQDFASIHVTAGTRADLSNYNVLGFSANNQGSTAFTVDEVTLKHGETIADFQAKAGMLYPLSLRSVLCSGSIISVFYKAK